MCLSATVVIGSSVCQRLLGLVRGFVSVCCDWFMGLSASVVIGKNGQSG